MMIAAKSIALPMAIMWRMGVTHLLSTHQWRAWDHVLILGERHLRSVLAEYARYYNGHRPHQGPQQKPPVRESGHVVDTTARIEHSQVLGGLISEYRRTA
jgi:hypothetical protein